MQKTTEIYVNEQQEEALNSSGFFPYYNIGNNLTFVIFGDMVNPIQQAFSLALATL